MDYGRTVTPIYFHSKNRRHIFIYYYGIPLSISVLLVSLLWLLCMYSKHYKGTSLVIQWLRIHLETQGTEVQSLITELRSHMPWSN